MVGVYGTCMLWLLRSSQAGRADTVRLPRQKLNPSLKPATEVCARIGAIQVSFITPEIKTRQDKTRRLHHSSQPG